MSRLGADRLKRAKTSAPIKSGPAILVCSSLDMILTVVTLSWTLGDLVQAAAMTAAANKKQVVGEVFFIFRRAASSSQGEY
jgi:hypothetical protein